MIESSTGIGGQNRSSALLNSKKTDSVNPIKLVGLSNTNNSNQVKTVGINLSSAGPNMVA